MHVPYLHWTMFSQHVGPARLSHCTEANAHAALMRDVANRLVWQLPTPICGELCHEASKLYTAGCKSILSPELDNSNCGICVQKLYWQSKKAL